MVTENKTLPPQVSQMDRLRWIAQTEVQNSSLYSKLIRVKHVEIFFFSKSQKDKINLSTLYTIQNFTLFGLKKNYSEKY